MEEFCRTCLGYAPPIHSVHISYKISLNKTVSQAVNEYASIQMSEQDLLPKYLCPKCYQQLLVVNDFRKLIISSDIHLKQKLISLTSYSDETPTDLSDAPSDLNTQDCVRYRNKSKINNEQIRDENQKYFRYSTESLRPRSDKPQAVKILSEEPENSFGKIQNWKSNKQKEAESVTQINNYYCKEESLFVDTQTKLTSDILEESNIKKEHIRTNPGRKPSQTSKNKRKVHEFKCDICKKVLFGRSNRLEQHIIMAHSDIRNYICQTCDKKFKSKQQLVNHTRVHTGQKPYQCDICKETFASTQNLFNHKKKHTGMYKSYKCEICEKGYSTPGELETHKRIVHTGEKPFLCEICSRAYSSARNLGLHIRSVHEKTEKCAKCGLMLSNTRIKQHVQKHQDKEDGIRRYTCDKCGKGYFTPHALKKHQFVHTGERPYSCEVCQKSFSQKSAVDTHMRTHSDVRGYCCELCTKTFKYKQHLQLHISKKHKDCNERKMLLINKDSNLIFADYVESDTH